ncbi:hypothetical protein [Kitasatospora sp. NPDC098663]|uniref:hypothetical protein n=1 Tax=Kitasatospora sp. NPDC098663 TaxID=3364096 RepID=UPI003828CEFC
MGIHGNGLVSKVMSGCAGLITAFTLLTACAAGASSPSPPFDVLSTVERGTTAGLEWRVELVHKGSELCTAAKVRDDLGRVFGRDQSARFTFAAGPVPVNRGA